MKLWFVGTKAEFRWLVRARDAEQARQVAHTGPGAQNADELGYGIDDLHPEEIEADGAPEIINLLD